MKTRTPLIAANWKMHKVLSEALAFMDTLQQAVGPLEDREVVIAPPFPYLLPVGQAIRTTGFSLAAQNCHEAAKGAFTGEVSVGMLRDVGCRYTIIGHSERRRLFGETDETVRRKVLAAFQGGLLPILCVGEVLEEREAGRAFAVIERQVGAALSGLGQGDVMQLVIAYEPVWAIGTGKTATPGQAQEIHAFIRERCVSLYDKEVAKAVRIVYGGSVKPDNVDALMAESDIDGLLVGGAGLETDSFRRIVQYRSL